MTAVLLLLLLVPLAGAAVLGALGRRLGAAAGGLAVGCAGATLLLAVLLGVGDRTAAPGRTLAPWHQVDLPWVAALGLRLHLGVDGISYPLVVLTALLTLLCCVYTRHVVPAPGRPATLLALILLLEVGMLGTFLALDLLLFFVFFETVLVPMYFVIAVWGGGRSRAAATKFVLYTLLGSVLLLVGLLAVHAKAGTFDLAALTQRGGAGMSHGYQVAAFLLLFLGFAVKSPLWPLHTWLPDAHTEAPTVGSVLLAGVLLKMGTYGLIRVAVPLLPAGARTLAPALGVLAVAGILAGSLVCLAQRELKRLIAYSSVGHMGFVLLGIATLSTVGLQAALVANVAHGVITGLLFFLVGAVKDRYHTGELADFGGGLAARLPVLGALVTFAAVASLGLPGLAGFWGEGFAVVAALRPAPGLPGRWYAVLAALAAVGGALAAAYFLRMLRRVVTGPEPVRWSDQSLVDARPAELVVWAPLVVLALLIGLWPRLVLGFSEPAVRALVGVFGG